MRDIPGYEGKYAASRDGKIWSYPKTSNLPGVDCLMPGKWLKQQLYTNRKNRIKPRSHYTVILYKNNKGKRYQVHCLVALTYAPNPENKPQVNHLDGNTLNNHDWNLEWVTQPENMIHAQKTGLLQQFTDKQVKTRSNNGKQTGAVNGMKARRMFTVGEAYCIRKIHEISGKSCRAIARAYSCSNKTVSSICNYTTYIREA